MASLIEIVTAICPGLAADASLAVYLDMAQADLSAGFFGARYDKAIALKAAHEWTLAQRNLGESGSISGKREGNASINFSSSGKGSQTAMADDLDQTHYGKQLKNIISSASPGISVIGADDEVVDQNTTVDPYSNSQDGD